MNWCKALCALSIAIYGSACLAQDITDVEAKPYGSYTGGAIDTIDLTTGNVMLDIPLISYPQLGTLPSLSFSVELNNAVPRCAVPIFDDFHSISECDDKFSLLFWNMYAN